MLRDLVIRQLARPELAVHVTQHGDLDRGVNAAGFSLIACVSVHVTANTASWCVGCRSSHSVSRMNPRNGSAIACPLPIETYQSRSVFQLRLKVHRFELAQVRIALARECDQRPEFAGRRPRRLKIFDGRRGQLLPDFNRRLLERIPCGCRLHDRAESLPHAHVSGRGNDHIPWKDVDLLGLLLDRT